MAQPHDWRGQTGDSWAAEWHRTDRSFAALTEELLRHAVALPFAQALEIGSGAGELAITLGQLRPQAQIIGVDLSERLTQTAQTRATGTANVGFAAGDAASWQAPEGFAPQLLFSRHGVMFFDDPHIAFRHFHDLAAPGAQLLFPASAHRPKAPSLPISMRCFRNRPLRLMNAFPRPCQRRARSPLPTQRRSKGYWRRPVGRTSH